MRVHLTKEQLLRPLGSQFDSDPEAKRFFSRVGSVNFGEGENDDEPIDFAALNRQLDADDRRSGVHRENGADHERKQ